MSNRGSNVTVLIGATFAASFKSVLREADRELTNLSKTTARTKLRHPPKPTAHELRERAKARFTVFESGQGGEWVE